MKFIILSFLLLATSINANLPPTTSKGIGDTIDVTTFKYRFPNQTISRSGTTTTFGGGVTTTQKNAITATAGMEAYDTTLNLKQYYNGTQWIANSNIQLDNVYSAKISNTATVTAENKDFIGTASVASTNVFTIPFNSGYFTVTPNCVITPGEDVRSLMQITAASASSLTVKTFSYLGVDLAVSFNIACQKQGADYQSTDAYISSNSNYDWTSYTPTFTGFGTTSPATSQCKHRRDGGDLEITCQMSLGTTTATLASMTLPNSLTLDSSRLVATNTTSNAGQMVGLMADNNSASGTYSAIVTATGTSTSLLYFTNVIGASTYLTPANGSAHASSSPVSFTIKVPISGWTNSSLIVASLQGTPNIPSSTGKIDALAVSFGTTNLNTVCSSSPCLIDQIGSGVSSITRASAGQYTLNTTRTYTRLKCTGQFNSPSVEYTGYTSSSQAYRCESCSAVNFGFQSRPSGTPMDVVGTLICYGEY